MASKPFTLRLPDESRESLVLLSTLLKRPQASIASEILKEELKRRAARIKALQEAREEAKKGEFVSHEAVEAWIMSVGTDNELPMPKPDVFFQPQTS